MAAGPQAHLQWHFTFSRKLLLCPLVVPAGEVSRRSRGKWALGAVTQSAPEANTLVGERSFSGGELQGQEV